MISRVVDDEVLASEGAETAERLANSAVAALGAARALLQESYSASFESHLEAETRSISQAGGQPECREGLAAFFEKRPARFRDL